MGQGERIRRWTNLLGLNHRTEHAGTKIAVLTCGYPVICHGCVGILYVFSGGDCKKLMLMNGKLSRHGEAEDPACSN
jgi:hypothetical protein